MYTLLTQTNLVKHKCWDINVTENTLIELVYDTTITSGSFI